VLPAVSQTGIGAIPALLGRRARMTAVEEFLDADRRAVAERVAEIFRWIFLVVLLILNNFGGIRLAGAQLFVNLVLLIWAAGNLLVMVLLTRGYKPGPQFGLATMAVDILAGTALVYFSNGLTSPYILALFLAIIASAVRFGLAFSLLCAVVVAFIYLFVGGTALNLQDFVSHPQLGLEAVGKVSELDLSDVEPTLHPLELSNVWAEDEPRPSLSVEEALANAPDRENDAFRVPAA